MLAKMFALFSFFSCKPENYKLRLEQARICSCNHNFFVGPLLLILKCVLLCFNYDDLTGRLLQTVSLSYKSRIPLINDDN